MNEALRRQIFEAPSPSEALELLRPALLDRRCRISPDVRRPRKGFNEVFELRGQHLRSIGAEVVGWDQLLESVDRSQEREILICLIRCRRQRIVVVADAAGDKLIGCAAFKAPEGRTMIGLDLADLATSLRELKEERFRERVRSAERGEFTLSLSEIASRIFDDTGLADAIDRNEPPEELDAPTFAALRDLDRTLLEMDQDASPEALLEDPKVEDLWRLADHAWVCLGDLRLKV